APVFAINVSSIDEKVEQLLKVGGTVVKPKMEMMGMGFYAYLKDSEGNVIGLWEDSKK
ncbi:MAG: glyoxalase/bleomycin resistance protein/dioxygenase, partial [Candidatus Peregrinibacteria bacterium Greene1014_49]